MFFVGFFFSMQSTSEKQHLSVAFHTYQQIKQQRDIEHRGLVLTISGSV